MASAVLGLSAALGFSQSLGDFARQQRLLKPASMAHVITNEELAASSKSNELARADVNPPIHISTPKRDTKQPSSVDVQGKILAQKQKVKELADRIAADQKQLAKHQSMNGSTVDRDTLSKSNLGIYERVTIQGLGTSSLAVCQQPDYIQEQRGLKDWCDEPAKLEADIAATQKQLATERATLDAMQEDARQQGFGNSVYDPD